VEENDRNIDLEGGKKDYSIKKRLDYFIRSALGQTAIEMNEIKKDVVFLEEQFAKQKANIEEQKTNEFNLEVVLSEHKKRINELELELATISKKNREEKKASQKDKLLHQEAEKSKEELVVSNKE